jgi:hypothetical protein
MTAAAVFRTATSRRVRQRDPRRRLGVRHRTIKSSLGRDTEDEGACSRALRRAGRGNLLVTAIEVLESHPDLSVPETTKLPLLTPSMRSNRGDCEEIEEWLAMGFATFR